MSETDSPLRPLFDLFRSMSTISDELIADYEMHCSVIKVRKNKYVASPLDQHESLFLITSGLLRGFIKKGGKDITTQFNSVGEIIGVIRHPAGAKAHHHEYLQALEDSELIVIPYSLIERAYELYPESHIIGRKTFSRHYYAASERSILARYPSATDRYHLFLESSAISLNRIPLRCLASYLGIRLETLSRIRSTSALGSKQKSV
ncbi:Crp/Fnr family transcriptional regulator [Pedobacter aquatilis]|uniref:Crp/Fnr family transcriptional regulator n=1 Tax=Pedobacter aquatilis TaxID=351343 RepID=UPI00292EC387|nr:Crp/Fnr family transcriptional regulator [Pedobacter aquatilis]